MTTIRIRRIAAFIFAGAALAMAALAQAQQKLVLYTSNESTLNEFAAAAFNRETGIKVDVVSAGSGVIIKRLQAEKDRPRTSRRTSMRSRPNTATRTICGSATTCTCS